MRNALILAGSLVLVLLLTGCSSSAPQARVVDFYRAPGTLSFAFERGVVLVLNGGPELRAQLENAVIAQSGRMRLVAASSVLQDGDMRGIETLRGRLLDQGYDGLLTMRVLRDTEVNPSQSEAGETFTTYAGSVPPGEDAFGGMALIEAKIFRVSDEALVWRAVAECPNSGDPQAVVAEAVRVMMDELRRTGLVHD